MTTLKFQSDTREDLVVSDIIKAQIRPNMGSTPTDQAFVQVGFPAADRWTRVRCARQGRRYFFHTCLPR